jgi:hypothetical protein
LPAGTFKANSPKICFEYQDTFADMIPLLIYNPTKEFMFLLYTLSQFVLLKIEKAPPTPIT